MVGGPEEEYNAAQELLSCMGANVVYCGQVGTGQVKTDVQTLKLTSIHPEQGCKIQNNKC